MGCIISIIGAVITLNCEAPRPTATQAAAILAAAPGLSNRTHVYTPSTLERRGPRVVFVPSTPQPALTPKGPSVCPSEITFPVEAIESSFLNCIEYAVLSDEFIARVLESAFTYNPDAERELLITERARLALGITNLTTVAAAGGDIPALAKALSDRDRSLKALDAKLAKPVTLPDREVLKAALELRKGECRDLLRGPHVAQARLILQHIIDLPIRIHNAPKPKFIKRGDTRGVEPTHEWRDGAYAPKWAAKTKPGGMLVGLVQSVASLMPASWNQIAVWLRQLDSLRATA